MKIIAIVTLTFSVTFIYMNIFSGEKCICIALEWHKVMRKTLTSSSFKFLPCQDGENSPITWTRWVIEFLHVWDDMHTSEMEISWTWTKYKFMDCGEKKNWLMGRGGAFIYSLTGFPEPRLGLCNFSSLKINFILFCCIFTYHGCIYLKISKIVHENKIQI